MGIPELRGPGLIVMDGVNLKDYGVISIRGSYDSLVMLPQMKAPSSYSWDTENYDDVDLNNRKTEARDITMTFLMSATTEMALLANRDLLINLLKADGWRYLYIGTLEKTYQLYYKGCDSASFINGGLTKKRIKMVLKFRLNN